MQLVTYPVFDQLVYCPVHFPQPRRLLLLTDSGHARQARVMDLMVEVEAA